MRKIYKFTSIILITLVFLLASYILIFGSIARKNNELLTFFGYSYSVVPTDSMDGSYEDSIKPVSIIITKNVKYEDLQLFDIVVFKAHHNNVLIVHRIIEIDDSGNLITKGDNPKATKDDPVTIDQYQAKVINIIKVPNFLAKTNNLQITLLLVLIITLISFAIYQVVIIVKTIKENKLKQIKALNEAKLREEILEELKKESED